jgi:hypothetical protein
MTKKQTVSVVSLALALMVVGSVAAYAMAGPMQAGADQAIGEAVVSKIAAVFQDAASKLWQ